MSVDEAIEIEGESDTDHREVARVLCAEVERLRKPEAWTHGWPLMGSSVIVGTMARCAGCGLELGLVCVAVGPGWVAPPEPNWPFARETCPVHARRIEPATEGPPRVVALWRRVKELEAKLAIHEAAEAARRCVGKDE